jgi:bifunctional DNase/RNase
VSVDARPSDAIALAVRTGAPIYVSEDVLETAGAPDLDGAARDEQRLELERFHEFVNGLSPEDFNVSGRDGGESRGDSRQAR